MDSLNACRIWLYMAKCHHFIITIKNHVYMEFRKTILMIIHAGHRRRHRCKEETFGFSGRRRGWDDLREQHWNMYITTCKTDEQCKFNAWSRAPKVGSLGQPRGIVSGGKWEGGSGCGGHVYTCGRFMLMYGQNHHNIVKCMHAKSLQSCPTLVWPHGP